MFWKNKYKYNTNVSFSVALQALKDGYTVRHANYSDVYLIMLNGKIFNITDRDESSAWEVEEFSTFDILLNNWVILEPHTFSIYKGNKNNENI